MKKVISLLLVATLLTAMLAVSFNALSVSDVEDGVPTVMSVSEGIAAYEEENEMEPGSLLTQRIYFMMPNGKNGSVATDDVYVHVPEKIDEETGEIVEEAHDDLVIKKGEKAPSWYNENNILDGKHYAGVYWWGGPAEVDGKWVGYRMEIEDYDQGIYYADIPYDPDDTAASVTVAIFNNGVDGGTDTSKPIYYQAAQTIDTNVEGAYPDDYDTTPYGSPDPWSFNNCIYIINPNRVSINPLNQKQTCGADWYVYYGDGCYGVEYKEGFGEDSEYPDGTPGWSDNVADICMNPDHFKDGVHVGYQPDVDDPTEAPTTAPTEAPQPAVIVDKDTDISVEGMIDAELVVEALDPTSATFVVSGQLLALYDITLQKDGQEAQPDGNVTVKIPSDDPNAKIYRAETDGTLTDMNAVYENGYYVFTTNHFSVYAVVGAAEPTEAPTVAPTEHVHSPAAAVAENVVPATCIAEGSYDEVVYCLECGEEISRTHKTIDKIAHNLTYVPAVAATEEAEGIKAHYVCSECNKLFSDAAGTIEVTATDLVIPKLDHQHTLKFKPGKKATTTADGWKSYFYCSECGKYFNNALGEMELTWDQIVIPKIVPTEPPTEAPKPTEAPTEAPKPTEAPTEAPKPTEAPTEAPKPTEAPTQAPTVPAELLGDVNGDGTVDSVDATLIQRADAGIISATADMIRRGDVDGDGQLTILDTTFIQRYLTGIKVSYPINQAIK